MALPGGLSFPGFDGDKDKLQKNWQAITERLQAGQDCAEDVMSHSISNGPREGLICACLGNRMQELKPCENSLLVLCSMQGNANELHPGLRSPAIHYCAHNANRRCMQLLLDAGADMEAPDVDGGPPPLYTAIIAGNAGAALELLERGCKATWTRADGGSMLHCWASWMADPQAKEQFKRMAPVDEEAQQLLLSLLKNGCDIAARQNTDGHGLTAFLTMKARKHESPWYRDQRTEKTFTQTSDQCFDILLATEDALKYKTQANEKLKGRKYDEAVKLYEKARAKLTDKNIEGHPVAVLWSNEGIARKKTADKEGAKRCFEEGLKQHCLPNIKDKLEYGLAHWEEEPAPAPAPDAKPKPLFSAAKKGFFNDAKKGLYGDEGSAQGQMPQYFLNPVNGGEAVIKVPINQPGGTGAKVTPLHCAPEPEEHAGEDIGTATADKMKWHGDSDDEEESKKEKSKEEES